jgi:hypothetical protein
LATLSSIADGGEGRGEEVLSFIENARSIIIGFMGEFRTPSMDSGCEFPEEFAHGTPEL